jgi:hypothetical protein
MCSEAIEQAAEAKRETLIRVERHAGSEEAREVRIAPILASNSACCATITRPSRHLSATSS